MLTNRSANSAVPGDLDIAIEAINALGLVHESHVHRHTLSESNNKQV